LDIGKDYDLLGCVAVYFVIRTFGRNLLPPSARQKKQNTVLLPMYQIIRRKMSEDRTLNNTAARTSNTIAGGSAVSFSTPTNDEEHGPKGVLHMEYVHLSKEFFVICRTEVHLSKIQNYF
jgi:hypothetical protein